MSRAFALLLGAWVVALAATLGALFIGEVLQIAPCPLCWYQRICMFPLALILALACWSDDRRGAVYALPLAWAGTGLATYHVLLLAGIVTPGWVPCGEALACTGQRLDALGGVPIPWLALASFVAIAALLCAYLRRTSPRRGR